MGRVVAAVRGCLYLAAVLPKNGDVCFLQQ